MVCSIPRLPRECHHSGPNANTLPIALLSDLRWNPHVISSDSKRCTEKSHTRLFGCFRSPLKVSGAPDNNLPTSPRVSLRPVLSFHLYSGSPPSLCMKGSSDEVLHLALSGASFSSTSAVLHHPFYFQITGISLPQ